MLTTETKPEDIAERHAALSISLDVYVKYFDMHAKDRDYFQGMEDTLEFLTTGRMPARFQEV